MAHTPPMTPTREIKLEVESPTLSSPMSPVFHGPDNPFNPRTELGRQLMHRRDRMHVNPIDKWIQANISLWESKPGDSRSIMTTMYPEEVMCDVELDVLPARVGGDSDPDDPFMEQYDQERYVLFLTITISSQSDTGTLVWYRKSPRAVLARHVGDRDSMLSPEWCRILDVGQSLSFTQPRIGIAEFFAKLALSVDNREEGTSDDILHWARNASVIGEAERKAFRGYQKHVTPSRPTVPLNSRTHRSHFTNQLGRTEDINEPVSPCLRYSPLEDAGADSDAD